MVISDIKIPEEISTRTEEHSSSDYVSFKAIDKKTKHEYHNKRTACYAGYLSVAKVYNFNCYPVDSESVLPFDIFTQWMELCKQNGLMPLKTSVENKDGKNTCIIPGSNRHITYAALCCYRWSENQPSIPWLTIKLMEANPSINFFQALHFALGKIVKIHAHSFSCICADPDANTTLGSGSTFRVANTNLLPSIAMSAFFTKNKRGKSKANKATGGHTYIEINKLISEMGFTIPEIGVNKNETKLLQVPNLEDVLREDWKVLYEKKIPKERLINYYEETLEKIKYPEKKPKTMWKRMTTYFTRINYDSELLTRIME